MGLVLGHTWNIFGARAIWKMAKNGQKWPPKWKWATVAQLAHPKPNPIWQTTNYYGKVLHFHIHYNLVGLGICPKPASGDLSAASYLKSSSWNWRQIIMQNCSNKNYRWQRVRRSLTQTHLPSKPPNCQIWYQKDWNECHLENPCNKEYLSVFASSNPTQFQITRMFRIWLK